MSGIKIKLESATDPLPSALYQLKMSLEAPMWDEPEKERIFENFLIVEKECKTKEGRYLSKLSGAFNIICGYLEKLAELNITETAQFIKTFDSLLGGIYKNNS